jgi:hypothetical protein
MSFSLRGLNHTARDTFLGGKVIALLYDTDQSLQQAEAKHKKQDRPQINGQIRHPASCRRTDGAVERPRGAIDGNGKAVNDWA